MITISELLEFSIEQEYSMVAHATFWAISKGFVQPNDDSEKMKYVELDRPAIEKLMQQNTLGLGEIKLYVVTVSKEWYAFYFARNVLEVNGLHRELFSQNVTKIVEAQRLMSNFMYFVDLEKSMDLFDYRKKILEFPAYIGHARAGEYNLFKFDRNEVKNVV